MKTPLNAAVIFFASSFFAVAQEPAKSPQVPTDCVPLRLSFETWEAPALEVAKRLDDLQSPAGLVKLRTECLKGIEGISLALSSVVAIDATQKVLAESITERIYPTEYEPPVLGCGSSQPLPPKVEPKDWAEALEEAFTHAVPTSFETRNTGQTVETEATAVPNLERVWDVRLAVEDVRFVGSDAFGADPLKIAMPVFSSFRSTGAYRLTEGEWRLLSVMEPPRGRDSQPTSRRWLTLVRVDRAR